MVGIVYSDATMSPPLKKHYPNGVPCFDNNNNNNNQQQQLTSQTKVDKNKMESGELTISMLANTLSIWLEMASERWRKQLVLTQLANDILTTLLFYDFKLSRLNVAI